MPESLAVAHAPMHPVERTMTSEQTPAGPLGTRVLVTSLTG
jgi:hypothetical protein